MQIFQPSSNHVMLYIVQMECIAHTISHIIMIVTCESRECNIMKFTTSSG